VERLWCKRDRGAPARDASRFSSKLLRRVDAVLVRPLGARQNAELDDARIARAEGSLGVDLSGYVARRP